VEFIVFRCARFKLINADRGVQARHVYGNLAASQLVTAAPSSDEFAMNSGGRVDWGRHVRRSLGALPQGRSSTPTVTATRKFPLRHPQFELACNRGSAVPLDTMAWHPPSSKELRYFAHVQHERTAPVKPLPAYVLAGLRFVDINNIAKLRGRAKRCLKERPWLEVPNA
jgi:hypothetical protein